MLSIEPKIRSAPTSALGRYLEAHGVDFKAIAHACGLSPNELSDPMHLVPVRKAAKLFAVSSQAIKDDSLSLKLAEASAAGNSGLMGHLAMASPSVRAFLECIAGYAPILITNVEVGFSDNGQTGRLFWRAPPGFDVPFQSISMFFAASIVHRIRTAAGPSWAPLAVSFEHKMPDIAPPLLALFGSRVSYDADCTSITFDATTLSLPIPTANPHLFAIYRHHANLLLREMVSEQADWALQVKRVISERLSTQATNLENVAAELSVSPRKLQRRLEQAGISFEKVLDDIRRVTAERLLRETDRPLVQVALDSGYNSQSTFTRAVRRWLHASPRAYRQQFR